MSIRRTPKVIELQQTTHSELALAISRYSDAEISRHSVFVAFLDGVQKYRFVNDEIWRKLPVVIDFERTKNLASAVEVFADFFFEISHRRHRTEASRQQRTQTLPGRYQLRMAQTTIQHFQNVHMRMHGIRLGNVQRPCM